MTIRTAVMADLPVLAGYDRHVSEQELENLIRLGRVTIAEADGEFLGWLRWNLFWDNTPFLNMLFLTEAHRGQGYGKAMMDHWEAVMKDQGFDRVMTSTASDEYAQHFYQKLGYTAIGGFTIPGDPYELIFCKEL
jgi:GNAT superfamily N-acetyltransferase